MPYVTRRSSDGASTTGINNGQDNSANSDSAESSDDSSGDSGDSSNGGSSGGSSDDGSSDGGSSGGGSSGGGSSGGDSSGGSSGGSSNGGSTTTTTGTGMPPAPPSYSWQLEDDQEDFLSWAGNYDIYNGQTPEYCSAGLYQEYIIDPDTGKYREQVVMKNDCHDIGWNIKYTITMPTVDLESLDIVYTTYD